MFSCVGMSVSVGEDFFMLVCVCLWSSCVLCRCPLSVSLSPVSVYFHMSQEVQGCVFSMLSVVSTGTKQLLSTHFDP